VPILYNPKYPNNKEIWLKAVGHPFIGANRIGKMIVVQGGSGIGNLNSVITGNGLEIEIKGENASIQAEAEQIPKLFANGNTNS